ncbi:MAG: gentisate 1,2-dioxygenase [Alphaproteobacteria bacterium]|nr:gentisate 1,2-dioxygenase [Alphaproteobacteria bacterium]
MLKPAERTPERDAYATRIGEDNMAPLWERLYALVTPEPRPQARPAIWHYDKLRPALMESGRLITAKEAERRVLILENPGLRGQSRVTHSLYAGWQLILPGEIAPSHRHTQSALRFIVEGDGAYTAVDGEKTVMKEGDFVITPSWTWHDHGNESDRPMVWLDGLDIPIVDLFDASFLEKTTEDRQELSRPVGDSLARYGNAMRPEGYKGGKHGRTSPILNYPYVRTREALDRLFRTKEIDPCHGLKLNYINPDDGDWAMPTIGPAMRLLPKGFATSAYRSTDATVFSVVEGRGRVELGETIYAFGPRDLFVVPSWHKFNLIAEDETVLFSYSDRPVQEKLGFWREDRGNR